MSPVFLVFLVLQEAKLSRVSVLFLVLHPYIDGKKYLCTSLG